MPYGAQPAGPYGPPPGAQPPYGPPPGQPAFGPPPGTPVQPPKKRTWLRIALGVVIVAVVAVGAVAWFTTSPDNAAAGDCLNVTQFKKGSEPSKVDCNDPSANMKIGVKLDSSSDSCPDGDYDTYTVSGTGSYKLCLMINAKEGDCFKNMTSDTDDGYQRVACTDPAAEGEFVKVINGTVDKSACDSVESDLVLTFSQPATTQCVKAASGSST